jgi:tetratricopeptide (TPR) repeat protein
MRAHYAIETGEAAPAPPPRAEALDLVAAASGAFAQGLLAIRKHDRAQAEAFLARLRSRRPPDGPAAMREPHHAPDIEAVAIMEQELEALLLLDEGKASEAVEALRRAAEREDRMPFEFGPPAPPKPAHELLGEALLALGHAPQAQAQFQLALQRAPKRALSLLGLARAAAKAGDAEASREAFAELRRIRARAD